MVYKFAEILKSLRTKKGLTQTQLASKLWLSKSVLNAYEQSLRMPSLEVLIKLSAEFNVSMEYLLGIEKSKTLDVSGLTDDQVLALSKIIELFRNQK